MATVLLLFNAFFLGLAHALEPDHVAAVSTFLSRYPSRGQAVRFCVRWGIGHMLPLLVAVVAVVTIGASLPIAVAAYAERVVGAMLILLGVWLLREVWIGRVHSHRHEHDGVVHTHLHAHTHVHDDEHTDTPHFHAHGPLLIGIVHGFAGSASVLVLALFAGASSAWLSGMYVAMFSGGVIAAMVLYGWTAGTLLERLAARQNVWLRRVQIGAGSCSLLLGVYWLA